jgi:hypothetical protein
MEGHFPHCLFREPFEYVYLVIVLHKEYVSRANQCFDPLHHVDMHLWKPSSDLLVISAI